MSIKCSADIKLYWYKNDVYLLSSTCNFTIISNKGFIFATSFSSNYLVLKTILVTMFTFPISPLGCRSSSASRALRGNDGNFIKSSWRKTTR